MQNIAYTASLILVAFASGYYFNNFVATAAAETTEVERPAYLIISINEIEPDKVQPYKDAVRPLVQKAGGAELLAVSPEENVQVLEGEWNYPGLLLVERFKSMAALKEYWYSEEYKEVKKLRDGVTETNFFVALEGRPLAK